MAKWLFISALLFLTSGLYAQKETVIIKVKQGYAVINKGAEHGVKGGDRFTLQTPYNPNEYGEVEVIRALRSIAAVKLVNGTSGYMLKVGDKEQSSESEIVDELFQETRADRYFESDRETYNSKPRIHRKGFIIGLGVGIGGMSINANSILGSGEVTRSAFLTDFRIGYAPTNTFEVYYVNKVFWWGESGWTLIHGLSSIGISTYLNKEKETGFFLATGAGVSTVDAPFENVNASYGLGFFGGVGYEFVRHWSFEADLLYSYISDGGVDLKFFGLQLTLNGLIY